MSQFLLPAGARRRDRASCTGSWGMAQLTHFPSLHPSPASRGSSRDLTITALHWPQCQPVVENCLHHLGLLS